MGKWIAALLGVLTATNGLLMLGAPEMWFQYAPGVAETGSFNRHFVSDVGAAYLAVAAGLLWTAWRPRQGWAALVVGTGFLFVHALIHVSERSAAMASIRCATFSACICRLWSAWPWPWP